ncbi:MAG: TVP38/TMEM64 family protein [Alphaproteobacteria bacterium]|nr:TVP38/TMEM64 family protein [Alphaproteobacteria bacterium]
MAVAVGVSSRLPARGVVAVGLVGLIVLGLVAAWISPERVVDVGENLMHAVRGLGARGAVVFATLQILVAVSGVLPASLLGVAAGAIYGLVPGFSLAAASTLAGALFSFFLSRSLFRATVERLAARRPRLRNLDTRIARDGWKLVCLLRVSPIMPFSATSLALGLSAVGLRDYAVGTLASLPALCGYVFIGTLADTSLSAWATGASPVRLVLLGIGVLATVVLVLRLGHIAIKLGLAPPAADNLEFTGDQNRADNLRAR